MILSFVSDSFFFCYLSYVPPTHQCRKRPFLRWIRSQGRSPHASGKAKIPSTPSAFPFIGAPGNTPPEGGKSLGPPDAGGTLQCRGTPVRTYRGTTAYRMRPNNWRGKVTNALKERPGTSFFPFLLHSLVVFLFV